MNFVECVLVTICFKVLADCCLDLWDVLEARRKIKEREYNEYTRRLVEIGERINRIDQRNNLVANKICVTNLRADRVIADNARVIDLHPIMTKDEWLEMFNGGRQ